MRVVRTRRGFGVELHTQNRLVLEAYPFERVVVQTQVGDLYLCRIEAASLDVVVMVLGGDEYFASGEVLNWMVATVVTELEPPFLPAERHAE